MMQVGIEILESQRNPNQVVFFLPQRRRRIHDHLLELTERREPRGDATAEIRALHDDVGFE